MPNLAKKLHKKKKERKKPTGFKMLREENLSKTALDTSLPKTYKVFRAVSLKVSRGIAVKLLFASILTKTKHILDKVGSNN